MPVAHTHPLLRGIAALLVLGGLGSATAACGSGPTTTEASASARSAGAHLGADEVAKLDPAKGYAVYCRSANRSRVALQIMASQGITNAYGLEGGIAAWTAAGGEVVRIGAPFPAPA